MRALAASLVAMIVGCGTDGGEGDGGSSPEQMLCVSETNRYRMMEGKPPLAYSREVEDYATTGAQVDFGSSPHNHFSMTGGGGIAFAENECPQQLGWTVAPGVDIRDVVRDCIQAFYDEGPGGGHFENMMGMYGTVGCGVYQSQGRVTIVQDFGR